MHTCLCMSLLGCIQSDLKDKPYGQLLYALLYERKYTVYKYTFHVVNCSSYISRSMQRFLENCDYSVILVNQSDCQISRMTSCTSVQTLNGNHHSYTCVKPSQLLLGVLVVILISQICFNCNGQFTIQCFVKM